MKSNKDFAVKVVRNFGDNTYSRGMELVLFSEDTAIEAVMASDEYWLNPSAQWDPYNKYGLRGTEEQYKLLYKDQVAALAAKADIAKFGDDWSDLKAHKDFEKEFLANFVPWWDQDPELVSVYKLVKIIWPESGQPRDDHSWPVALTFAGAKVAFREFCKDKIDEIGSSRGGLEDDDILIGQCTFQINRKGKPVCQWVVTHEEVQYTSIKEWLDYRKATVLEEPEDELYLERWLQKNGAICSGACSLVYDQLGAALGLE